MPDRSDAERLDALEAQVADLRHEIAQLARAVLGVDGQAPEMARAVRVIHLGMVDGDHLLAAEMEDTTGELTLSPPQRWSAQGMVQGTELIGRLLYGLDDPSAVLVRPVRVREIEQRRDGIIFGWDNRNADGRIVSGEALWDRELLREALQVWQHALDAGP